MKEYVMLSPEMLKDRATIDRWLAISADFVRSLPPKVTKKKKQRFCRKRF